LWYSHYDSAWERGYHVIRRSSFTDLRLAKSEVSELLGDVWQKLDDEELSRITISHIKI